MTATILPPIRIDIPNDETTKGVGKVPARLSEPRSPNAKSPEEQATSEKRHAMLAMLETEAKVARAKRCAERAAENAARKLRLEAKRVERAIQARDKVTEACDKVSENMRAKRDAASARRSALFEAVREARAARAADKESRLAVLSDRGASAARRQAAKVQHVQVKAKYLDWMAEMQEMLLTRARALLRAEMLESCCCGAPGQ